MYHSHRFYFIIVRLSSTFLLDALTILKNRGYDSAGIAMVSTGGHERNDDESAGPSCLVRLLGICFGGYGLS
jgi:hypothetical protein